MTDNRIQELEAALLAARAIINGKTFTVDEAQELVAQARADAKVAVGLAIERAEVAAKNVATGFHDGISGDWHPYSGLTMINETCKAIRAIAPEDAIAEVTEWKRLAIAGNLIALEMRNMEAERDRLANELAAAHDKYQRDVFGLNNEGDPIGGDPPSGLKQRADKAEAELAAANAREAGLRDFIGDFANAKIDALRYQPSYGESPEDEPDPVVDAETVWAWQADAKSALAQPSTEGGA